MDYEWLNAKADIYMPRAIKINSDIDRNGVRILLVPEYGVYVDCFGLSLRKNNCRGELLLKVSFTYDGCNSCDINIDSDGVVADGKKYSETIIMPSK